MGFGTNTRFRFATDHQVEFFNDLISDLGLSPRDAIRDAGFPSLDDRDPARLSRETMSDVIEYLREERRDMQADRRGGPRY